MRLFSIFFLHLFSVPSFIFTKNGRGLILVYPQRIVEIILYLYSKDDFTYGHSIQYQMLLVRLMRLFLIFSSFIFCLIIYLCEKWKGTYFCLPSKDSLNYSLCLLKGWFHLWSFYSVQNASCSFTCISFKT